MKPNTARRRNRRGFSVGEVLVALTIFGFLSVAVVQVIIFLARSQAVTTTRLNSVVTGQNIMGKLSNAALRARVFVVYSDYAQWGYDLGSLPKAQRYAFQQSVHMGSGESGNYLVMVDLHDDPDPSDKMPAPVSKITGVYVDPTEWKTSGSAPTVLANAPQFLPVRYFEQEFDSTAGVVGDGNTILEDLLPTGSDVSSHRVLGYVDRASLTSSPLFYLNDLDSVTVNLPIKFRDEERSASLLVQTTLYFTGD